MFFCREAGRLYGVMSVPLCAIFVGQLGTKELFSFSCVVSVGQMGGH